MAVALGSAEATVAQQTERPQVTSPILTIDSDRLFEDSSYGQLTIEEFEARGAALAAENRRIEAELEAEEQELTELRPTIAPVDFRLLADDFDARVQEIRRAQDSKSRALNTELEERRVVFLNSAVPILEQLMRETGAAVVIEKRTVFISSNAVDITPIAIDRLNMVLTGPDVPDPQQ
ncbi:MAG: OmpH family outer membrane protein [Pseudomonadota bacterium]